jgi:hypothetical protein
MLERHQRHRRYDLLALACASCALVCSIVHPFKIYWDNVMELLSLYSLLLICTCMSVTDGAPSKSTKQFLSAVVLIPSIILFLYLLRSKWSKLKRLHHQLADENEKYGLVWYKNVVRVVLKFAIILVDTIKSIGRSYKQRAQSGLALFGSRIQKLPNDDNNKQSRLSLSANSNDNYNHNPNDSVPRSIVDDDDDGKDSVDQMTHKSEDRTVYHLLND